MASEIHFLVPATVLAKIPSLGITLGQNDTVKLVMPDAADQDTFPVCLMVTSPEVKPVGYTVETRTTYKLRLKTIANYLETLGESLPGAAKLNFAIEGTNLRIYAS